MLQSSINGHQALRVQGDHAEIVLLKGMDGPHILPSHHNMDMGRLTTNALMGLTA
jgi:hypothetical protein